MGNEWLAEQIGLGAIAMVAWFGKVLHSRQGNLDERISKLSTETQQIVGKETHELRRVIDRNHSQVIDLLLSRHGNNHEHD